LGSPPSFTWQPIKLLVGKDGYEIVDLERKRKRILVRRLVDLMNRSLIFYVDLRDVIIRVVNRLLYLRRRSGKIN